MCACVQLSIINTDQFTSLVGDGYISFPCHPQKIIYGQEPLYPVGHIEGDEDIAQAVGEVARSELKGMVYRSGRYAILMAFKDLGALHRTATKDEICRAGQKHCSSPMEANYMAGQQFGAWKAVDGLVARNFIVRRKNQGAGVGFSTQKHQFSLTEEGRALVALAEAKWGSAGRAGGADEGAATVVNRSAAAARAAAVGPSAFGSAGSPMRLSGAHVAGAGAGHTLGGGGGAAAAWRTNAAAGMGASTTPVSGTRGRRTADQLAADDEKDLRAWLQLRTTTYESVHMIKVCCCW